MLFNDYKCGWIPIERLENKCITKIVTGYDCFFALELDGNVWGCGNNDFMQLGLTTTCRKYPTIIRYFTKNKIRIRDIKCGHFSCFSN